jgi:hypothetical protein
MSGVLHPMGPEPAQTYWVRRGMLLVVVLVLAVIVVFAVANLTKAAVATSPPPVIPAAGTSPDPSTSATPNVASSTPAATPSAASSGSPAATVSAPTSAGPTTSTAAKPSTSTAARTSTSTAARTSASPTGKPSATVIGTPDCTPAALRVAVKGDRSLSPGQNNTFRLSLTNGAAHTCLASVTSKNFELKIFSGKDRIWSSRDCAKTLAAFDKKLATRAEVAWNMTWNGERSVKGKECKRGTDTPLAGTYWATAQLAGAKPVQLRMIVS